MAKKLYLTELGKDMVVSSLGGQSIAFTNFSVGEGTIATPTRDNLKSRTSLVTPVPGLSNITITSGIEMNSYIKLTGSFSSDDDFNLPDSRTSFKWTELGVFACGQGDESFNADGTTTTFTLTNTTNMVYHVDFTEGDVTTTVPKTDYSFNATTNSVSFTIAPASGIVIKVYYPDVSSNQLFAYGYETSPNTVSETAVGSVSNSYSIETSFSISNDNTDVTIKFDTTSSNAPYAIFSAHVSNHDNPHRVNANQIGLDSMNVNSLTARFSTDEDVLQNLESGETLSTLFHKIHAAIAYVIKFFTYGYDEDGVHINGHLNNVDNPHHTSFSSMEGSVPITSGGTGSNGVNGTFTAFWQYLTHMNAPQRNPYGQILVSRYIGTFAAPTEEGYTPHTVSTQMKSDIKAVIVLPYCGFNRLMDFQLGTPTTYGGMALDGFKCRANSSYGSSGDQWDAYSAIRINNNYYSTYKAFEVGYEWDYVQTDFIDVMYYYIAISADGIYDFGKGTNNPTFIP